MTTQKKLGDQAELLVARHLEKKGFKVLEMNYKKKYGEIDIIAIKGKVLAFVEVKMRSSYYFDLSQVITYAKQKKICNVASIYIADYSQHDDIDCRFDVALVEICNNEPKITYLPNAFGA